MAGKTPKGVATRQAILAAAAGVFARQGYAGTRMDDIFAATGLTKGAVYFHFASKEALAWAVVEDHKRRWLELARDEVESSTEALEQFRRLAELLIRLSSADESTWSVVRLAEQVGVHSAADIAASAGPMTDWIALMDEVIRRGQRQGVFDKRHSAADVAVAVVASFDGLKAISDALGEDERAAFTRRARLLVSLLETGIRA
ncbi:TetR/AcrR family transcriptional regulator [Mycetocola spongiae]|uniref:TetR/AcrR family transcriptional regulator n=1 Tax=Mycetocola spongiae TaxID=2859226 RepID=UPI001CF3C53E|nr:TetR/AcrR family transcriptional regulator [Mycetocola spongiae]UCR88911.1 TetR/AcrR family transcriptional regulator [Mycetocola spongiae]